MTADIRGGPRGTPFTLNHPKSSHSYAPTLSDSHDSNVASEPHPVAVAVQPRRHFQNHIQLLENKAKLTSIRLSVLSAEPGPTVPSTPVKSDEFQQELRSEPSSILLGDETSRQSQPGTSSRSKTIKGQQSSSTLRSHYDREKIPITISQQTSESSARDFALRKGHPAVLLPEKQRKHFFETSKSRAKSNAKKQRANPVDISTLFPRPGTNTRSDNPPYYKMHVKRPKAGTRHWFDSYDEDMSDSESNNEPEMQAEFADCLQNAFPDVSREVLPVIEQPPKARSPGTAKSSRFLGIPDSIPFRPAISNSTHSLQSSGDPKQEIAAISPFRSVNLHEQSVLFLSDDEDEEEEANEAEAPAASRPGTRLTGATIRDSIVQEVLNDTDIEVGTARTVRSQPAVVSNESCAKHGTPRSDPGSKANMRVVVPSRRSSKMASFFADPSPLLHHQVEISRSATTSSNSGRDLEVLSQTSRPDDTSEGSLMSLPIENSDIAPSELTWDETMPSTMSFERRVSTCLMPVTRQEQMLLAAMRSKKVHMRRRSVHHEGNARWEDEEQLGDTFYEHRPQTSVDINAPAFLELGRNNYADWVSHRRSSFLADDVLQNEGWRESVTTFQTTSHRGSTRFSSCLSDEGQEVPVTSASGSGRNSGLQRTSTGLSTQFSISSDDFQNRALTHTRNRTDSSHIIVLDELNDSPKERESLGSGSPRFPAWAYNGWSDKAGLATAH